MKPANRRALDHALGLPHGYVSRDEPDYYDDDEESDLIRQPDVYGLARTLAQRLGATTLVDIGCGKAAKLLDISHGFDIIGVDFGDNIEFCRRAYPQHRWEELDLEHISQDWLGSIPSSSVVVCGDVIEHLRDPRPLLGLLRSATEAGMSAVVSTPDRALIYPDDRPGPPSLGAHVREWTCSEFRHLLLDHGIPLAAIGWTRPSIGTDEASTILAVAVPGLPVPDDRTPDVADGLISPVHRSPHDHIEHARRLGFDSIEITDAALVLRGLELSAGRAHRRPVHRAPLEVGSGGRGTYPFNLVAVDDVGEACDVDDCRRSVRRHLAISAIGTDPSSDIWADESRRWLLHREHVLSAGFDEANAIRSDLARQLEDSRTAAARTTADLRTQLDDANSTAEKITADLRAQLDDLRAVEADLRRTSAAVEAELRDRLGEAVAAAEEWRARHDEMQRVVEERRAQLTAEAEQRARTLPDTDRSNLSIPAPYAPRRAGSAAARRLAPRFAALLRRAASLPRLGRLQRAADDMAASAVPAHSVPAWLFDAEFYLRAFPPAATSGVSAVAHYDMVGWRLGLSPHPLFAAGWYLGNHPDVRTAGVDPLRHFVEVGWALGYDPHPLFSVSWYLEHSPDVAAAGMNPLEHYLVHGWQEARDPHPLFDSAGYLQRRADVAAAGMNPLVHYVVHGHRERTAPSAVFDPWFYLSRTPQSIESSLPQYWYYLEVGAYCGDVTFDAPTW